MLRRTDNKPQYSIAIKTSKGNTVGYINLTDAFVKVATGKDSLHCTANDIANIDGGLATYLSKLEIVIDTKQSAKQPVGLDQY
jgi:hypothetical protein